MSVVVLFYFFSTCTSDSQNTQQIEKKDGAELAEIYCGNCHIYPTPDLLPKSAWGNVLTQMGYQLGIVAEGYDHYANMNMQEAFNIQTVGVYPTSPAMSDSAWQKIIRFYLDNAPDTLELSQQPDLIPNTLFKVSALQIPTLSYITMVDIDEQGKSLYLSDVRGRLARLNSKFEITQVTNLPNPVIQIIQHNSTNELLTGNIGNMHPNDLKTSGILKMNLSDFNEKSLLIKDIPRLVNFQVLDVNKDGMDDIISCGYGHLTGTFAWYKNMGDTYEMKTIKNIPGTLKVIPTDLDHDDDIDLVTLFAQGNEGIVAFYNENGVFKEKQLLRFHPLSGSSDFELVDFDEDGDLDILISSGDNGDYSYTLKPYHGIRIFINQGDFKFKESYFFPMYGASKLRASDFDGDGDLDLLAISFYPDFRDFSS